VEGIWKRAKYRRGSASFGETTFDEIITEVDRIPGRFDSEQERFVYPYA
jgi:hypothetical protein